MPNDTNRIPYDEMRPKVDLIINEMHELIELLTRFRDRDFGEDIGAHIRIADRIAACGSGPIIIVNPPVPNPVGRCDEVITLSWSQTLEASEHLLGAVVLGVRQLRHMSDPDS